MALPNGLTRKKLEALVWRNTHRDFRGTTNGERNILHNEHKGNGTELWFLSQFTDEQLMEKLPKAVRESILAGVIPR